MFKYESKYNFLNFFKYFFSKFENFYLWIIFLLPKGDLTDPNLVTDLCANLDCVFHIAALVGPYHPQDAYIKVNYEGSRNVLTGCQKQGVKKIVFSSSPSTRFPFPDPNVRNLTEDQLREVNGGEYAPVFLQPYAETKAMGEKLIREACGSKEGDLLTIAVAPHQVHTFYFTR